MQSGKVTITIKGNDSTSVALKYADTLYYQVNGMGDYVQETH
jgi:hypothetical protein